MLELGTTDAGSGLAHDLFDRHVQLSELRAHLAVLMICLLGWYVLSGLQLRLRHPAILLGLHHVGVFEIVRLQVLLGAQLAHGLLHLRRPLVEAELGRAHARLSGRCGRRKALHHLGFTLLFGRYDLAWVLLRTDERHLLLV